jgi:catechol 2,3-dioxygenase-like lactoylglutathione lyase family enzyme
MKIQFIAGFGPIVRDVAQSRAFWGDHLGIALEEAAPQYFTNDDLEGVKAFALWPLSQAAESCFGTDAWPDDIPAPAAWLEFDLESPDAVAPAAAEMVGRGHRLLKETSSSRGARQSPAFSVRRGSWEASSTPHGCIRTAKLKRPRSLRPEITQFRLVDPTTRMGPIWQSSNV